MKPSGFWVKLVGLGMLGLGSVVVTSSLLGQDPRQVQAPKRSAREGSSLPPKAPVRRFQSGKIVVNSIRQLTPEEIAKRELRDRSPEAWRDEMQAIQEEYRKNPKVGASTVAKSFDVKAEGPLVTVSAHAVMYDTLPTNRYRWIAPGVRSHAEGPAGRAGLRRPGLRPPGPDGDGSYLQGHDRARPWGLLCGTGDGLRPGGGRLHDRPNKGDQRGPSRHPAEHEGRGRALSRPAPPSSPRP